MKTLARPVADAPKQTVTFATQAKSRDDSPGVVDAQLVTYGLLNAYGRVFVPGGAADSIQTMKDAGRPLPMGYQHSPFEPLEVIGKWPAEDLVESADALRGAGRISNTQCGQDAATLVKDEAITGTSIGFVPLVVQYAAPGERCTFQTPYGERSYAFDDFVQYVIEYDLQEASLVSAPADDEARISAIQSVVANASRALPALQSDTWEDAAYSMALLLGGRGASSFADLPDVEHFQLFQTIAGVYRQHGKTAPTYERRPVYDDVEFQHDERTVFADRYLRRSLRTVVAGAGGFQGQLSPETREEAERAIQLLGGLTQRRTATEQLHELAESVRAAAALTTGED